MAKLYPKNRRGIKIMLTSERSLHTMVTDVCVKSHFFYFFSKN